MCRKTAGSARWRLLDDIRTNRYGRVLELRESVLIGFPGEISRKGECRPMRELFELFDRGGDASELILRDVERLPLLSLLLLVAATVQLRLKTRFVSVNFTFKRASHLI